MPRGPKAVESPRNRGQLAELVVPQLFSGRLRNPSFTRFRLTLHVDLELYGIWPYEQLRVRFADPSGS
eukprot:1189121-Prorocentrum_minimum.AAC.1